MGRPDVTTTLLFLPTAHSGFRWLRIGADATLSEGEGVPLLDEGTIAIAPADAVTLHWAELPSRSPAQATAAARILVGEASAAPMGELHVAIGDEGVDERPIGVVSVAAMQNWLSVLEGAGIDPLAVVPAPLLLPRPDEGYAWAEVGGQRIVRGRASAFADEPLLTELVTGGTEPRTVEPEALAAALARQVDAPVLDLRQGPFARRRRFAIDWRSVRRSAVLALGVLAATLAIDLVRIAKYDFAADALEARSDALAATGLPRGETVTDPDRQLNARLAGVRGPGLGFSRTTAAIYAAVRSVPGSELTALDFQPNGTLRASVAVARESLATDLRRAIEAAGFAVDASVFQSANGRVTGDLTVRPT